MFKLVEANEDFQEEKPYYIFFGNLCIGQYKNKKFAKQFTKMLNRELNREYQPW